MRREISGRALPWGAACGVRGRVRGLARGLGGGRGESGQMAVEVAVLVPIVIVMCLTIYNLMRFIELSALFDRVASDAIVSHGVAPSGTQSEHAASAAVRGCIEDALGGDGIEVEVWTRGASSGGGSGPGRVTFPISPLLTRFTCVLRYRPWPSSFSMGNTVYLSPLVLTHECSLVVDRYRPGVVV